MKKNLKLVGALATLALLGMTNVYAKDCTDLQNKINEAASGSVVQAESCDGNLNVESGKNIILDLYGNTINTSLIEIKGNVVLKDSIGNGKIVGNTSNYKAAIGVEGNLTIESGEIEANEHAILAKNGGSITVNGGSVKAKYSALSGNGTLGAMKFKVNGGMLTSNDGPAVYMPGPISYTMTGGTINGGLLFRMGIIYISGGKILGQTNRDALDDLQQYYNYSGYVNYPDAISIVGGTYTTNIEGQTNKLELNITGGEFSSTYGSAVAFYDLGKVAQDAKINISNGTFETLSQDRESYQILTLSDLGVTNPAEGYNKEELMGKVNTTITGGTYNSDVTKYLTEEYVQKDGVVNKKESDPTPVDPIKPEENDITVNYPTIPSFENVEKLTVGLDNASEAKNAFKDALKYLNIEENADVLVNVEVNNLEEKDINEDELKSMFDTLKKSQPNAKIAGYLNIALNVMNTLDNSKIGELIELDSKIKFNIALPKEVKNVEDGFTRTYYVIRYHNGKSDIIAANLNDDKNSVSFETDKFSTYALAYKDTKEETVVPKTFDGIGTYLGISVITILSIFGLTTYLKRQKRNN